MNWIWYIFINIIAFFISLYIWVFIELYDAYKNQNQFDSFLDYLDYVINQINRFK